MSRRSTERAEEAHLPIDSDVDLRRDAPPAPRRRRTWDVLAVIALGGGAGSAARFLVGQAFPASPTGFPWATFAVNVAGCFALGALMVFVLDVWPPRRYIRPFLGVGFLGGFTTFSTFAAEIVERLGNGAWTTADAYAADSLIAGLVTVWCGIALARAVAGLPVRRRGRTGP